VKNPFKGDALGVHFAVNIFIATTFLWLVLRHWAVLNPIWAISSMVAASDPKPKQAAKFFHGRFVNGLIGCVIGLLVLVIGGSSDWKIPFALSLSVLVSTYLVRVQVMLRQAPITAAIVVAGGLAHHSKETGVEEGLRRVGEVLLGCVVGLAVSLLMAKLWPPPEEGYSMAISFVPNLVVIDRFLLEGPC
jgi:uncharacterized membrane protein YccC